MGEDIVIRVEELGKRYRMGETLDLTSTFREALMSLPARWGRSAVQTLKTISQKPGTADGDSETPEGTFWALRDISFEVKRGEVVGIIGSNGAGKSTLLKILSRITGPTKGMAEIHGRVRSLLEVGTGFHDDLTGRENIYLNGAILGMRKAEVDARFDEIIAFAEIGEFLDTPVKRYSSGMRVRLGFAVAAHLEPEILIVDEVLAVGDAAFQAKCLGRMGSIAQGGRTVLFVSHNMAAVRHLCSRAILLKKGRMVADGDATPVVVQYLQPTGGAFEERIGYRANRVLMEQNVHPDFRITDIGLFQVSGEILQEIRTGDPLLMRIHYMAKREFASPAFVVKLKSDLGVEVLRLSTMPISGFPIKRLGAQGRVDLVIASLPVTGGQYALDVEFAGDKEEALVRLEQVVTFRVEPKDVYHSGALLDQRRGQIVAPHSWSHAIEQGGDGETKTGVHVPLSEIPREKGFGERIRILEGCLLNAQGASARQFEVSEPFSVQAQLGALDGSYEDIYLNIGIDGALQQRIATVTNRTHHGFFTCAKGSRLATQAAIQGLSLSPGNYTISIKAGCRGRIADALEHILPFEVLETRQEKAIYHAPLQGIIQVFADWRLVEPREGGEDNTAAPERRLDSKAAGGTA